MKRAREVWENEQKVKRQKTNKLAEDSQNQSAVQDHYNQRKEQKNMERKTSTIVHLRRLNNWIKSVLFSKYVKRGHSVLDLCAGKGGDLLKWRSIGIAEVHFFDCAIALVRLAVDRYNKMVSDWESDRHKRTLYSANFYAADCFQADLDEILEEDVVFDIVSSQFAIHYAFESEARVRALLHNISCRLRKGGFFIATTIDANRLVRRWREHPVTGGAHGDEHSFGNRKYSVKFVAESTGFTRHSLAKKLLHPEEPFGIKYYFNLDDAIEQCPEFLVHIPTLSRIAEEYGLSLESETNFHHFFVKEFDKQGNRKLLTRMGVLNEKGTIPVEDWEIASLYVILVFRKKQHLEPRPERDVPRASVIHNTDIVSIV